MLRTDVDAGSKGDVDDGVRRALRFVEMLSSILERDSRRKSRSTRVLKQNCGVNWAGADVGFDMIRDRLGEREGDGLGLGRDLTFAILGSRSPEYVACGGEVVGESAQNHASLIVRVRVGEKSELSKTRSTGLS